MISAVAEMYGIHPQTLRLYEREGLLKPSRTEGQMPPVRETVRALCVGGVALVLDV